MTMAYISSGARIVKVQINGDISAAQLVEMLNSGEVAIDLRSREIYIPPEGGAEGYVVIGKVIREFITSEPWKVAEKPADEV